MAALVLAMVMLTGTIGVDTDYDTLLWELQDQDGFVALVPTDGAIHAIFSGAAPALPLTVDGLPVVTHEFQEPQRMRMEVASVTDITPTEAMSHGIAPLPEDAVGIGPGSPLLQNIGGSWYICSANFVFQSGGKYYLGSAGHCFLESGKTASHGSGADYNLNQVTVEVCVNWCYFGGQLQGFLGDMVTLGSPTYARQTGPGGDIGNDFGVIEIPAQYEHLIRPEMPMWGGPTGANGNEGTGNSVVHYGNGIEAGTFMTSKGRTGTSLNDGDSSSWQALVSIAGGDSGSAINHGDEFGGLHGEEALGIVTHGLVVPGVPLGWGTSIERALTMGREAGLSLELVLAGGSTTPPPEPPAPEDPPAGLDAAKGRKGKNHVVDLSWTSGGATVDIKVNGNVGATVSNSGSYTDNLGKNPSGSFTYQVCNAGTSDCSGTVTVVY